MSEDRWTEAMARLVNDHPLAWLVSGGPGAPQATPLPLRPVLGVGGEITHLLGHYARGNPQVEALRRDGRALALFLGPQAYVSPSWLDDRTQAPTWNYAAAEFVIEVAFVEPGGEGELLRDLVDAMEAGREQAWSQDELGERYALLAPRIVGFRARVVEARPRFKLGQTEPERFFVQIRAGLERTGQHDLSAWMADFGRL